MANDIIGGKSPAACNDFSRSEAIRVYVKGDRSRPWQKRSRINYRGGSDPCDIRLVRVADDNESRGFMELIDELDRFLRRFLPAF